MLNCSPWGLIYVSLLHDVLVPRRNTAESPQNEDDDLLRAV